MHLKMSAIGARNEKRIKQRALSIFFKLMFLVKIEEKKKKRTKNSVYSRNNMIANFSSVKLPLKSIKERSSSELITSYRTKTDEMNHNGF